MGLVFDWDAKKASTNFKKHHVLFEEACTIFGDSLSRTIPDSSHSVSEHRYITMGLSAKSRLLVVVHTDRGDCIRLISARMATKRERVNYEEEN